MENLISVDLVDHSLHNIQYRLRNRIPVAPQNVSYVEPPLISTIPNNFYNAEEVKNLQKLNFNQQQQIYDRFKEERDGKLITFNDIIQKEQNKQNEKLFLQEVFPREYKEAENKMLGNGCHCQNPKFAIQ